MPGMARAHRAASRSGCCSPWWPDRAPDGSQCERWPCGTSAITTSMVRGARCGLRLVGSSASARKWRVSSGWFWARSSIRAARRSVLWSASACDSLPYSWWSAAISRRRSAMPSGVSSARFRTARARASGSASEATIWRIDDQCRMARVQSKVAPPQQGSYRVTGVARWSGGRRARQRWNSSSATGPGTRYDRAGFGRPGRWRSRSSRRVPGRIGTASPNRVSPSRCRMWRFLLMRSLPVQPDGNASRSGMAKNCRHDSWVMLRDYLR